MAKFLLGVLIGILLCFLFTYLIREKALKTLGGNSVDIDKKTVNVISPSNYEQISLIVHHNFS